MIRDYKIDGWESWAKIKNDNHYFNGLIKAIYKKEGIDNVEFNKCFSSTNFVGCYGDFVIKIYTPSEAENGENSFENEIIGTNHYLKKNIKTPQIIAYGKINYGYKFNYIITERLVGKTYFEQSEKFSNFEKFELGQKLNEICKKTNVIIEQFNNYDVIKQAIENDRWQSFTDTFNEERIDFYKNIDTKKLVFTHGDLNQKNIILQDGEVFVIDFGECANLPKNYEIAEVFTFDDSVQSGFFENYTKDEFVKICKESLLIHDFGADIIESSFGKTTLNDLKELESLLVERFDSLKKENDLCKN